ncbi:SWIM zinc finger family protein [Actinokineospora spheciospongiae]|uniref:SWIM zinc finger family protein n=1 Tax=Actinokineospora spheciospongiae TaxID=909613 RepID=UPI000D718AAE|nr:SWIM zinc finger family protein [Actinokineospora spheciospongiae]PWW58470.1 putative Zn finger protein [Actinokineospora spheciospongiae]
MSDDEWWRDAPAKPVIRVEDGVRARSQRGEIARSWWSRRFLSVLESLGLSGRLDRGKRYARQGQVLSLSLSKSIVVGQVQGTRPEPYRVRIVARAFTDEQWEQVEQALAGQAVFLAKLLAGDMPDDIEAVFDGVGLRLFPDDLQDLSMDCTCPDWQVPCKHLAAACYLLAESFDTDPFEILAWRGRGRQELLDNLRGLRERSGPTPAEEREPPLSELLEEFWGPPTTPPAPVAQPAVAAPDALLDQLDALPVIVRGKPLVELLRPAYRAMVEESE